MTRIPFNVCGLSPVYTIAEDVWIVFHRDDLNHMDEQGQLAPGQIVVAAVPTGAPWGPGPGYLTFTTAEEATTFLQAAQDAGGVPVAWRETLPLFP